MLVFGRKQDATVYSARDKLTFKLIQALSTSKHRLGPLMALCS